MASPLINNELVSFVVAKPFTSREKVYSVGDDFPQEDARDIETFIRARYVIPVYDDTIEGRTPPYNHGVRPKAEVLDKLAHAKVQLRMPWEHDSDDEVNLGVLTYPHTMPPVEPTPEPADEPEEEPEPDPAAVDDPEPPESLEETYDPTEHNVDAVKEYIAEHPEQEEAVLAMERANRGRKGILGDE